MINKRFLCEEFKTLTLMLLG